MNHLLGYTALLLNLASMSMKNILHLRLLSLVANALYILYGILLDSPPFVIGCSLAVAIHAFHIHKIYLRKKSDLLKVPHQDSH